MTTIDPETKAGTPTPNAAGAPDAASGAATARQMNHKLVAAPMCGNCKTDTYLYIEEFTPALIDDEGQLAQLPEASYLCTRCVGYAAHAVPPLWTPESHRTTK